MSELSVLIPSLRTVKSTTVLPAPVENADVYFNHAILVGELLRIDMAEFTSIVNEVYTVYGAGHDSFFINLDFNPMISGLDAVLTGIGKAVDKRGRVLSSPEGSELRNSSLLRVESDNSLTIISHVIHLTDLVDNLQAMREQFAFAKEHNFLVKYP